MTFNDLEYLQKHVRVPSECMESFKELIETGKLHLSESGNQLLLAIKIQRGLSEEEISKATGIPVNKLSLMIVQRVKITKITANKLSKLGYPAIAFLKEIC